MLTRRARLPSARGAGSVRDAPVPAARARLAQGRSVLQRRRASATAGCSCRPDSRPPARRAGGGARAGLRRDGGDASSAYAARSRRRASSRWRSTIAAGARAARFIYLAEPHAMGRSPALLAAHREGAAPPQAPAAGRAGHRHPQRHHVPAGRTRRRSRAHRRLGHRPRRRPRRVRRRRWTPASRRPWRRCR